MKVEEKSRFSAAKENGFKRWDIPGSPCPTQIRLDLSGFHVSNQRLEKRSFGEASTCASGTF